MLIPKKPKKSKQEKREWFNKEKIKKPMKKELAEKTKKLIEKKSKSQMKEIVYSYMCPGCKSSFSAGNLQTRIIEAARRKDSYISCPKCGVALVADKLMKVSTKQNSKVNRNANLTAVYPNQGINITPSYTPSSWTDRAVLEKIAHELGKFVTSFGFFNPQLKFQRGIRGKVSANAPENVRAAEFTVEAVDDYDLRFRVVAAAGITPAGKVVLPKYFMTLDGREIPFTKEAVAEFLSGKVFGPTDPKPVVPELHYKDRDPVRFREIVASRKKKAITFEKQVVAVNDTWGVVQERHFPVIRIEIPQGTLGRLLRINPTSSNVIFDASPILAANPDLGQKAKDKYIQGKKDFWGEHFEEKFDEEESKIADDYFIGIDESWADLQTQSEIRVTSVPNKDLEVQKQASRKKKAAGVPTPGQSVEYQGKNYTVDSITGDASILTDEAGVQTAPVPNADLNIQVEEGAVPPAPTLADRINKLVKRSLRDEKTLVPFTDPAPDYSVAKQTDVDADFSVPYKDSDQGILSEDERAVQKMFRGGSVIKPVKTAAEVSLDNVQKMFEEDIMESRLPGGNMEEMLSSFLNFHHIQLSRDEYREVLANAYQRWEGEIFEGPGGVEWVIEEGESKKIERKTSIKKTAVIDIGNRVRVPDGREGTVTAITPDYFDPEKDKEITVYTVAIDLGELEPFELKDLTRISGVKERGYARKKIAEPTGYHETDDTGKVIELSRLRTLVQDYARAGQLPLDFDLTKVMSEVSRMTRKDLLEILDKKQKGQHYPVVHAKKEGLEKTAYKKKGEIPQEKFEVGDEVRVNIPGDLWHNQEGEVFIAHPRLDEYEVHFPDGNIGIFGGAMLGKIGSKKPMRKKISSKSTNAIVREMRKAELTEEDVKKDIKEEEEGEKHYNQMAKDVDSPKTEKVLKDMAEDEADHAEELEEVVLPAVKNTKNYLEKYDSRKKKAQEEEGVLFAVVEFLNVKLDPEDFEKGSEDEKDFIEEHLTFQVFKYDNVFAVEYDEEEATSPDFKGIIDSLKDYLSESSAVLSLGKPKISYASRKKKAQEEGEEEKPKTTLKELKTKPHGRPPAEEVAEAPAAAPELQTVFNEVKQHQQRLTEIKAVINEARRKTEEEIRKIQEEQGSVEEAAELQEGIEKLSSLIEQSESQIADLGEFFVWLDTESKTKKFKPTDKWRVEKLLEKFGKDAEDYLSKAERGASSLNTEIEQRLLTVFPKLPKDKEGSIQKKADVLSAITELGSGLWSYVKEISGIISEGEQLELALE